MKMKNIDTLYPIGVRSKNKILIYFFK